MSNIKILKIALFVTIAILIVSVLIGIVTRNSFIDNLEQREYMNGNYEIQIAPDLNNVYYSGNVDNVNDIEEISDVIIKAKVKSNVDRNYNSGMTITNVDVLEIYKGEIGTEEIYIIEPICYLSEPGFISSVMGYYWMNDNDEYILFLDKCEDVHLGGYDDIYIFTTIQYSKFNLSIPDDMKNAQVQYPIYDKLYEEIKQGYMRGD